MKFDAHPSALALLVGLAYIAKFDLNTLAVFLMSIVLHELAHYVAARYHSIEVKVIGVNWLGIYLRRPAVFGMEGLTICLAGPLMSAFLCVVTDGPARAFNLGMVVIASASDFLHAFRCLKGK